MPPDILNLDIRNQVYTYKPSQTSYLPASNLLNNLAPSKRLVPMPRKSYKMFFQNVTPSIRISNTLSMGLYGFVGGKPCFPKQLNNHQSLQMRQNSGILNSNNSIICKRKSLLVHTFCFE
jgi:hypothetical protein